MLLTGATPSPISGTMGQFRTTSVQFQSSEMLTGRTMRVNAALFVDNSNSSALVPPNSGWRLVYPAAAGVYAMNFISSDPYKNYYVELEVVDAYTFVIHYGFIFHTDLNGYIAGVPPLDNNSPFLPGGMYSEPQGIEFFVSDGLTNVYQYVPVNANPFCTDTVTFRTDGVDNGFAPGQALNLTFSIDETAISSNYFLGFFETTGISNAVNFVQDSGLSYARIANGAQGVPGIDNDCITGGTGFVGREDRFSATAQIDKACLNVGSCYRAYIVYQQGGEWKSCISDEICATSAAVPPIIGDFDCTITDGLGNEYNECCLSNAPTCGDTEICVSPDVASFDALIAAAGIDGVFSDFYSGVSAFVSDSLPTPESPGTSIRFNANGYEACTIYQPAGGETQVKYFVFRYAINYGTHYDYLDVVVQIGFNGSVQNVDYTGTFSDGTQMNNQFCAESPGPLTLEYEDETFAGCVLRSSTNGASAVPADVISNVPGQIVIDPGTIAVGDQVCFISCCVEPDVSTPCDCGEICDTISFNIEQDTCGFVEGESNGSVSLLFALQGVPSNEVASVVILTSTGATLNSSTGALNELFTVPFSDPARIGYDIVVTLENGCVYEPPIIWLETQGSDAGPACVASYLSSVSAASCDCSVVDDDCTNFASIEPSCDPATGEIDFTTFESFSSPVSEDVIQCSEDGSSFGPCSLPYVGDELYVRRSVKFTDSCPDILIEQLITCEQTQVCQNQSTLEYNIVDGVLTLTLMTGYTSPVGTETIFVSLDGGAVFGIYAGPVTLSGGETIVAYAVTTFTDGCPDLTSNTITETYTFDCDYTGYAVECAFDDLTGFFTATFTGDESVLAVNNKLYSSAGGNPVTPYPGPVTGTIFVIKWEIALPGCETICLVAACADCDAITAECFDAGNGDDSAGC